jgi:hypothetical protein
VRSDDSVIPHPIGMLGTIITINGEEKFLEGWDLEDIDTKAQAEYGVSIFRNETVSVPEPESTALFKRVRPNMPTTPTWLTRLPS